MRDAVDSGGWFQFFGVQRVFVDAALSAQEAIQKVDYLAWEHCVELAHGEDDYRVVHLPWDEDLF
jgi:hypothetical protein